MNNNLNFGANPRLSIKSVKNENENENENNDKNATLVLSEQLELLLIGAIKENT